VNRKNRTAYRYKDFVLYKLQRKLLVPMPLQILPTISLTLIFLLALQNTILLHYHRFLGYTPYHSEVHLLIGMNIYDTMLDLNKRYHNSQVPRVEQELLILSEHLSSPLILSGVLCCSIFSFMCNAL
jgi:hypothetical protein